MIFDVEGVAVALTVVVLVVERVAAVEIVSVNTFVVAAVAGAAVLIVPAMSFVVFLTVVDSSVEEVAAALTVITIVVAVEDAGHAGPESS